MRKQYCMEWINKTGRDGFKSIGHDCPELAEKELMKKIKQKSCASAWLTWNYTGEDVPDNEFGVDHYIKGVRKESVEILGFGTVYFDDEIIVVE